MNKLIIITYKKNYKCFVLLDCSNGLVEEHIHQTIVRKKLTKFSLEISLGIFIRTIILIVEIMRLTH